jgi:hypothetical protein
VQARPGSAPSPAMIRAISRGILTAVLVISGSVI